MPLYEFTCPDCLGFDVTFTMLDVPDSTECIHCGSSSPRKMTAPRISRSSSAAFRLTESTMRSAHEPDVVSALPGPSASRRGSVTTNPLHTKLPRP
ncbi:MAG TPA: FmdB family zinc ribbon protein [Glaciihabitans sp.]|nr:FmdB family zinc ribbon protein [Glaciihabitans sp.]